LPVALDAKPSGAAVPTAAGKVQISPDIYKSIGVRPLINCRGTFTVNSGSFELPDVRGAIIPGAMNSRTDSFVRATSIV